MFAAVSDGPHGHPPLSRGVLPISDYISLAKDHNCRVVVEVKTVEGLTLSIQYLQNLI